ncbi:MAG: hypothetical protein ACRD0K_22355 [Egibacteraceae bacterium]
MDSKTTTTALFVIAAIAMLGAALWVGVANQLGSGDTSQQTASPSPQPETVEDVAAADVAADDAGALAVAEDDAADNAGALAVAEDDAADNASPSPTAQPLVDPEPTAPAPAVAAPAPSPSPDINGLHVLCPLRDGGSAHLLLTADTYYRAATPEEIALLTERFGPPVTTIDPNVLPPLSPISVTDALAGRAQ